jgi:hypothetical protein
LYIDDVDDFFLVIIVYFKLTKKVFDSDSYDDDDDIDDDNDNDDNDGDRNKDNDDDNNYNDGNDVLLIYNRANMRHLQ